MTIKLNRGRVALVVAALAVGIAGVSYAAVPAANGTISACRDSKGALKVIDAEAGQTCNANQQPLTWNQQGPAGPQGPVGPQGPDGSARAHAEVNYWGDVGGGNLTNANVYKDGTGHYCFGGLGFTPQTAVVTLGSQSTVPGTPTVRVRLPVESSCPIGFRQALVTLYNPETQTHDDEEFFILFN